MKTLISANISCEGLSVTIDSLTPVTASPLILDKSALTLSLYFRFQDNDTAVKSHYFVFASFDFLARESPCEANIQIKQR